VKPILHRGKLAKAPKVLAVRALTREDLAVLKTAERTIPRVKAFRDTHHRLARLVAAGLRNEEILRITGFSAVRLSTLKQDPAFMELVAQYRSAVDASFTASMDEFYDTATSNMLRMERQVEEHLDRLDEASELAPLQTLFKGIGDRADRFGYSKKTVNVNINQDFAKRMEKIMAERGQSAVIDAPVSVAQLEHGPERQMDEGETPSRDANSAPRAGFRRRM
jgi:hypothetical protein